jgi:serine/threonine protein kinase
MLLSAGTRLGPYEILAPLGRGGMGEVYRARDSRLGRDVAIKILPEHLASNAEALARFEREPSRRHSPRPTPEASSIARRVGLIHLPGVPRNISACKMGGPARDRNR